MRRREKSDTAIYAENLSKQYRIGGRQRCYRTLREATVDAVALPIRYLRSRWRGTPKDDSRIWALRDVSLDIKQGEVTGIIGRNGSGKTTLLRVLSRISEPTSGWAHVYGKVGSLLEVGSGFHPELSGRENVYLNGVILGMRKREIDRKFDQIVAFAEVERFIDTPVKHYSSGMYMRLAFAVAAHLSADILLIDEVLAVGDALFQTKCLHKMEDVARQGRTVLFVSHNMGAVRSLCNRGVVLDEGRVVHAGNVAEALEVYFRTIGALAGASGQEPADATPTRSCFGPIRVTQRDPGASILQDESLAVSTTLRVPADASGFNINCILEDMLGRRIFQVAETSTSLGCPMPPEGTHVIRITVPPLWLTAGLYSIFFKVNFWSDSGGTVHFSDRYPLDVAGGSSVDKSVLSPRVQWSTQPLP